MADDFSLQLGYDALGFRFQEEQPPCHSFTFAVGPARLVYLHSLQQLARWNSEPEHSKNVFG
jgi:hypothetical protein